MGITRKDFIAQFFSDDTNIVDLIEVYIHEKNILTLSSYDWAVEDTIETRFNDKTTINCWAMNNESVPCLIRIRDFPVYVFVELPTKIGNSYMNWTSSTAMRLFDKLKYRMGERGPYDARFEMKPKLYNFDDNKKYPHLWVFFDNLEYMREFARRIEKPLNFEEREINLKIHENSIGIERKMLTKRNIGYTQWFDVKVETVPDDEKLTTVKTLNAENRSIDFPEYYAKFQDLSPADPDRVKKWTTRPKVLAYDGEMYTDKHRTFPKALDAKHVAYMISCVIQTTGRPETMKRVGIIYGKCYHIPPKKLSNTTIICVNSELEMMQEFARVVREYDPTVLVGYNNFSFDNVYFDTRLSRINEDWPLFGRTDKETKLTGRDWESSGFGKNVIKVIAADGRISIDLLTLAKRDFKLKNYKLETVARHVLKVGKHDISPVQMFEAYEAIIEAERLLNELRAKYGNMIDQYIESKYDDCGEIRKDHVNYFIKALPKDLTNIIFDYSQNLVDIDNSIDKIHMAKIKMRDVMSYCIQDSELLIRMMDKMNTWLGLVSMSDVVGVAIQNLFTRGQQIRCMSQIYHLAAQAGRVLDKRPSEGRSFKGGAVKKPKTGVSRNIITLDFKSLYPSIIQAYNICYTTFVRQEQEHLVRDEDCNIIEFDQEEDDFAPAGSDDEADDNEESEKKVQKVTKHYRLRFVKAHILPGILPKLVKDLVDARNMIRGLQKKVSKDSLEWAMLEARQLAVKQSANSIFGFLGVGKGGMLPLLEGAMAITAWGRSLIARVEKFVGEKYGGKTVYGDTDSVMIDLGITDCKESDRMGHVLADEISGVPARDGKPAIPGLFEAPLAMEFEKAFYILFCLTPKRYAGILIDGKTGKPMYDDKDIFLRGLDLAKRDKCPYHHTVYRELLMCILKERPFLEGFEVVMNRIKKMMNGEVHHSQFAVTSVIGQYSASSKYPMKLFSDNLNKWGIPVQPGDRLESVICRELNHPLKPRSADRIKIGNMLRTPEQLDEEILLPLRPGSGDFLIADKEVKVNSYLPDQRYRSVEVNYVYYITNRLQNPLTQLFNLGYQSDINYLVNNNFTFRPSNRHGIVTADRIIEIVGKVIQHCGKQALDPMIEGVKAHIGRKNSAVIIPKTLTLNISSDSKDVKSCNSNGSLGASEVKNSRGVGKSNEVKIVLRLAPKPEPQITLNMKSKEENSDTIPFRLL